MPLDVLHADNHVLLVAKPAGLPTVPDATGDASLLDEAREWIARTAHKPGRVWLGVVHRLDRPVSGVVCFARTSKAANRLTRAFQGRAVEKEYLGVVGGPLPSPVGELEQWLVKDRTRNTVRAVPGPSGGARLAVTRWRVLAERPGRVLVALVPETGRPHQLRVAMATLGRPLLGDLRYGAPEPLPDRSIALHARRLSIPHPTRPERVEGIAEPPPLDVWNCT